MKICIFCSANSNIDRYFFQLTWELGTRLAQNGHTIVFGGTDMGLMECIANAAKTAGGQVIGVVPSKVEENGHISQHMDVHIPCDNLNDRKALMMAQSDLFIALPGGIGTLDEIFSVAASATIGYHQKMVVLYNVGGFWDAVIAALDNLQQQGMVRGQWQQYIKIVNSVDELALLV